MSTSDPADDSTTPAAPPPTGPTPSTEAAAPDAPAVPDAAAAPHAGDKPPAPDAGDKATAPDAGGGSTTPDAPPQPATSEAPEAPAAPDASFTTHLVDDTPLDPTRARGDQSPAAAARAAAARVAPDPGRHATERPAPVPPTPLDPAASDPATTAPLGAAPLAAASLAAAPTPTRPVGDARPEPPAYATAPLPTTPLPASPVPPITPEPPVQDPSLFPAPNAPRSPSAGTHVLGVIVGLILGPIAVGAVLLGQSRILAVQVDHWDASLDVLGIVLVTAGLLLLGCVLLLGLWTAAVPITAGVVLTALGGFFLYAPGIARRQTLNLLTTEGWHTQVTQVTVVGTSGTLVVAGFLLLLGGLVIAGARRHGVHLGEFRERNRA